jgi:hypothetical protein
MNPVNWLRLFIKHIVRDMVFRHSKFRRWNPMKKSKDGNRNSITGQWAKIKNHNKQKLIHIIKQKDCSCLPEQKDGIVNSASL